LIASTKPDNATTSNIWYKRLQHIAPDLEKNHPLHRAAHWLTSWRALAGKRPVHDLLDKIYSQGNLIARFESAFPSHLATRVRANLTRFIELALEVDNGRYPGLGYFLVRLKHSKAMQKDAPDEGKVNAEYSCVRILTIHGSKGLEAPVIFLADAEHVKKHNFAYKTLVDWPPESTQPDYFVLPGKKDEHDSVTRHRIEQHLLAENRENANLLYVAITRARQLLIITGCKAKKKSNPGWYGLIKEQLQAHNIISNSADIETNVIMESGTMPLSVDHVAEQQKPVKLTINPELKNAFSNNVFTLNGFASQAPSQDIEKTASTHSAQSEDAKRRGTLIHRMLELLSINQNQEKSALLNKIANEYHFSLQDALLKDCWDESLSVYAHSDFAYLYDASKFTQAYNEVAITYQSGETTINGIIDRLVICDRDIYIVDYKTHQDDGNSRIEDIAQQYLNQMASYHKGVKQMWPEKTVKPLILFTACKSIYEFRI